MEVEVGPLVIRERLKAHRVEVELGRLHHVDDVEAERLAAQLPRAKVAAPAEVVRLHHRAVGEHPAVAVSPHLLRQLRLAEGAPHAVAGAQVPVEGERVGAARRAARRQVVGVGGELVARAARPERGGGGEDGARARRAPEALPRHGRQVVGRHRAGERQRVVGAQVQRLGEAVLPASVGPALERREVLAARVGVAERHQRRVAGAHHHRLEQAHVEPVADAAGELGGGENRRLEPDAPRVEELLGRAVLRAHRLKEVEPLEEEGPLLGEERLGGGEVLNHRVGLHLAEVGVERAGERQLGGEAHLEVDAQVERGVEQARRGPGRVAVLRPHHTARRQVRAQLDIAVGVEVLQAGEGPEARDRQRARVGRVGLARNQRRVEHLVGAGHLPPHLDAPAAASPRVAQRAQGNRQLRRPPLRVDRDRRRPTPRPRCRWS